MNEQETNKLIDSVVEELNAELKLGLDADVSRTALAAGIEPEEEQPPIDREASVIYGVAVATEGEAEGHNTLLDETFIGQVVDAGNAAKSGIKARFDHPNMSSTSMGTAIGRFRDFRQDGPIARANLHFLKAAKKAPDGTNYPDYIMDLAEEDPQSFGTSIVFKNNPIKQVDENGNALKDKEGNELPTLARLNKLMAADVVDQPAANPNGFFSTPAQESLAAKLTNFLDRYLTNHGLVLTAKKPEEKEIMQTETTVNEDKGQETTLSTQEAIQAERVRISKIMKFGNQNGCTSEFLEGLIAGGTDAMECYDAIAEDAQTRRFSERQAALNKIEGESNPSAGGAIDGLETPTATNYETIEEEAEAEWKANKDGVREEYLSKEDYVAFRKFSEEGRIKLFEKVA